MGEIKLKLQFFAGEKTEPATPKKRRDVRKKGQVFKSQDLIMAATILLAFSLLPNFLNFIADYALRYVSSALAIQQSSDFTIEFVSKLFQNNIGVLLVCVLPFMLAIALTGLGINLLQTGFLHVPEVIRPKFERINPLEGFKRMFSKKSIVNLLKSIIKVILVGYIVYLALSQSIIKVTSLSQVSLGDAYRLMIELSPT